MIVAARRIYFLALAGRGSTVWVVGAAGALIGVDMSIVGLGWLVPMPSQPLKGTIKWQPTRPNVARRITFRII
jgi:hypothetical protein